MLADGSNAASIACLSLVASISGGNGSSDSTSPIGHGWVEGSGSRLATFAGVKFTDVWPTGSVTQPWLPKYLAVRVTPFGSVTWTAFAARSMTGLPSLCRTSYGAVKEPTFSAAKSGLSPVTNTAEHMILAKPEA